MARLSDDKLVDRVLGGDVAAFAELVRRYEQPLAAMIRRRVSDRHHCEDVLQATLLQAWRDLRRLRDRSKVKSWLIGIACNRCRDFHKSTQRRDEPTHDRALQAYLNRSGRAVRGGDEAEQVCEAMLKIVPRQRKLIELFYLEGLTIAEIGRRLRKPEGTVKSGLFHARRAMRRALGVPRSERDTPS